MSVVPGTTPYAWPFDGALNAARLALVIAGCQYEWRDRSIEGARVEGTLRDLAAALAVQGALIVRLRHRTAREQPGAWVALESHHQVEAAGLDGFFGSDLDPRLRGAGRDLLALAGFGLEAAVHSTLRSANDRGYECITLRDACSALVPGGEAAAYSTIEMSGGIFGAVGTAEALLHTLTATRQEHA